MTNEGGRWGVELQKVEWKFHSPFKRSLPFVCGGSEESLTSCVIKEKGGKKTLSVFLCSLFSSQSVGRLVSLTALLPLALVRSPSQRDVVST